MKTRVVFFSLPLITLLKSAFPTCESTAERGSSNI